MMRRFNRASCCVRLVALFGMLFVVSACVATAPNTVSQNNELREMFSAAFSDIHDIYLDPIDVNILAMEGLNGLSHIEPAAVLKREGDDVQFRINGTLVGRAVAPATNDSDAWAKTVDILIAAGKKSSSKLRNSDNERIYKVVFSGFLKNLDRYSRYAGMTQARRDRESRNGFGGVGISIKPDAAGARIVRVSRNSPALRAGVQKGDVITAVDGAPLAGEPLAKVVDLLRGPIGKKVAISLHRASQTAPFIAVVSRTRIIPDTVFYEPRGTVAYIRVTSFNQDTANQLKKSVRKAQRHLGPSLTGLVLDLRNNPGGLLTQAVEAADLFIEYGRISSTTGRHQDSVQRFESTQGDITSGLPIAVLINGASASAAEIMAAALQDNARAILVGSNSFGKGTVQTVLRLPNDGELILTWARLLAPSGYVLHRLGVLPNICTSEARDSESLLKAALVEDLERQRAAFSRRRMVRNRKIAAEKEVQTSCPWRPRQGEDIDIDIAKRILESGEMYKQAVAISAPIAGS
ncbi:MAG: PDZ domain-containing protein [Alphaproteobacteria bacterium]|nr:PDZ domain-containing protein [Alphaproteobacteria bacterium]